MLKVTSGAEELIFSTVQIQTKYADGSTGSGTGFIYNFLNPSNPDEGMPFVVSNRHVVEDATHAGLVFNKKDASGNVALGDLLGIEIDDLQTAWTYHSDPNVDIAVMPLGRLQDIVTAQGSDIFYKGIPDDWIPTEEELSDQLDAIEDVLIIGYPNGIYDRKHQIPVVRKGTTATPIQVNFEGDPTFLIDASIFPGSSGSPVLLYQTGAFSIRGEGTFSGNRAHLLGIVASVFTMSDVNEIQTIPVPTRRIPVVETTQMIDLGVVFKSHLIREAAIEYMVGIGLMDPPGSA